MVHYTLVLELTSPLAVSMRRQANVIPTLGRVGPSMVRGALAGLALRTVRPTDDRFQQAFVQGGIRTSSLLPVVVEGKNELEEVEVFEAPQTLMGCKRVKEHGYIDGLFATTHYALLDRTSKDFAGAEDIKKRITAMASLRQCPVCTSVLKAAGGQLSYDWSGVFDSTGSPGKRLQTHVGLERDRRGAAQGVLYSREVINESTDEKRVYIQASVSGEEALMKWLSGDVLQEGTTLHIGNAISRGLGRCTVVRFNKALKRATVRERIERFKDQFAAASAEAGPLLSDRFLISLMLDTPAFFVDPFLRPNTSPSALDLVQAYTQQERGAVEVLNALEKVHQSARVYKYVGWNQLAGFPRTTEYGLEAGSVLVFMADSLDAPLIDALEHMENKGVGLNREAGFGRVTVCHPIHSEMHQFKALKEETA